MTLQDEYVARVKEELTALGYVVLKEGSYKKAQERQRVARVMEEHAIEDAEDARRWARDCLAEERRLRERLTFVYGIARAHGATDDELRGYGESDILAVVEMARSEADSGAPGPMVATYVELALMHELRLHIGDWRTCDECHRLLGTPAAEALSP